VTTSKSYAHSHGEARYFRDTRPSLH